MEFLKQITSLEAKRACLVQAKDKVYVFEIVDGKLIDMRTNKLLDVTLDVFADENIQHFIFVDDELAKLILPFIK